MWSFVAVAVLLLAVPAARADTKESFQKAIRPLAEGCKDSAQASNDDVETVVHLRDDFSDPAKCLSACVMEKMALLKDGKFTPYEEHLQTYRALFADDPKRLARAQEVVSGCTADAERKFSGKKCDMAHDAIICLLKMTG